MRLRLSVLLFRSGLRRIVRLLLRLCFWLRSCRTWLRLNVLLFGPGLCGVMRLLLWHRSWLCLWSRPCFRPGSGCFRMLGLRRRTSFRSCCVFRSVGWSPTGFRRRPSPRIRGPRSGRWLVHMCLGSHGIFWSDLRSGSRFRPCCHVVCGPIRWSSDWSCCNSIPVEVIHRGCGSGDCSNRGGAVIGLEEVGTVFLCQVGVRYLGTYRTH